MMGPQLTITPALPARGRNRGTILFLVTIVIGLVTLAAVGFTMSMRNANMAAHLQADQSQVEQVGKSAIDFLGTLASMSRSERDGWGGMKHNADLFQDIRVDWDLHGERHGRFCILSPMYTPASSVPQFRFGVQSTSGKLPLRTLMRWERREPGLGQATLMKLPGMTPDLADSLLDWLDDDDTKREFGEESGFYRSKDPPRNAPNAIPRHISELQAVRGFNAFVLLGHQDGIFQAIEPSTNHFGTAGAMSPPEMTIPNDQGNQPIQDGNQWNLEAPPWSYYLTARSAQRNESYDGRPRINLNDRDLQRLYSALQATFDSRIASFVVATRRFGPSKSVGNATNRTPPRNAVRGKATFEFVSVFDLVDAYVAVPRQQTNELDYFESPFSSDDIASLARFTQFADLTTLRRSSRLFGQIDIMEAPRLVLEMIPGLSPETVDQILDVRSEPTVDGMPRVHVAWLLEAQILDIETMRRVAPFITVGGDIFEAQIVAMYDAQSPWFRAEVVIDGTRRSDQTLYYRDLRRLGRGFDFSNLIPPTTGNVSSGRSTSTPLESGRTFQVPPMPSGSSLTSGL